MKLATQETISIRSCPLSVTGRLTAFFFQWKPDKKSCWICSRRQLVGLALALSATIIQPLSSWWRERFPYETAGQATITCRILSSTLSQFFTDPIAFTQVHSQKFSLKKTFIESLETHHCASLASLSSDPEANQRPYVLVLEEGTRPVLWPTQ